MRFSDSASGARSWLARLAPACLTALLLAGCASDGMIGEAEASPVIQQGMASFYSDRFQGRRTASGERFDQRELTAAHRSLPFGTRVLVTRRDNGRQVEVLINDRGPFVDGRVIDLSKSAARELGMISRGTAPVQLSYIR